MGGHRIIDQQRRQWAREEADRRLTRDQRARIVAAGRERDAALAALAEEDRANAPDPSDVTAVERWMAASEVRAREIHAHFYEAERIVRAGASK